jgi:hypothetical protein
VESIAVLPYRPMAAQTDHQSADLGFIAPPIHLACPIPDLDDLGHEFVCSWGTGHCMAKIVEGSRRTKCEYAMMWIETESIGALQNTGAFLSD